MIVKVASTPEYFPRALEKSRFLLRRLKEIYNKDTKFFLNQIEFVLVKKNKYNQIIKQYRNKQPVQ